ncbi:hypothetical protein ABIC10_009527 [Bradyrhizobium sp. S3.2.12]
MAGLARYVTKTSRGRSPRTWLDEGTTGRCDVIANSK